MIYKAQNVSQEAKSKGVYACVWMRMHTFGQKPKRARLPLEGQ